MLTDIKLTSLDLDNLLEELLARVRDIIAVDTAAVLLLERGADGLVARTACGIEAEVRQGVRVPIGIGFAGRIAATRQAVRLDRVDSTTVSNPILWEKGIKTMLGVPLLSGEELLGVLHVGRLVRSKGLRDVLHALGLVSWRRGGLVAANDLIAAAIAADTVIAPSLTRVASTPSARAASSFSRTATSCAPKRDCAIKRVTTSAMATSARINQ